MNELITAIKNRDIEKLKHLKELYNLKIDLENNKLIIGNKDLLKKQAEYWDTQQYVRKILLNSLYGAILNESCIFYDKKIGQSVTLTGRLITKFMSEKINELITGEKDYLGDAIVYGDTDSVTGDSVIITNYGKMTISELFNICSIKWNFNDKEYACDDKIKILGYNSKEEKEEFYSFNYVYRHKVNKDLYLVIDSNDNQVKITEDHSLIIAENSKLIDRKPIDVDNNSEIISLIEK